MPNSGFLHQPRPPCQRDPPPWSWGEDSLRCSLPLFGSRGQVWCPRPPQGVEKLLAQVHMNIIRQSHPPFGAGALYNPDLLGGRWIHALCAATWLEAPWSSTRSVASRGSSVPFVWKVSNLWSVKTCTFVATKLSWSSLVGIVYGVVLDLGIYLPKTCTFISSFYFPI